MNKIVSFPYSYRIIAAKFIENLRKTVNSKLKGNKINKTPEVQNTPLSFCGMDVAISREVIFYIQISFIFNIL